MIIGSLIWIYLGGFVAILYWKLFFCKIQLYPIYSFLQPTLKEEILALALEAEKGAKVYIFYEPVSIHNFTTMLHQLLFEFGVAWNSGHYDINSVISGNFINFYSHCLFGCILWQTLYFSTYCYSFVWKDRHSFMLTLWNGYFHGIRCLLILIVLVTIFQEINDFLFFKTTYNDLDGHVPCSIFRHFFAAIEYSESSGYNFDKSIKIVIKFIAHNFIVPFILYHSGLTFYMILIMIEYPYKKFFSE